ncbi:MAG: ABC transporter substrate-binding protein, partial [Anaerolineae bacterium]|nr:ABC transporter substrate-binding protein [Anaerolineae bacterium]
LARSELYGEGRPLNLFVQLFEHGVAVPWPATPLSADVNDCFGGAARHIIVEGADVQTELDVVAEEIDLLIVGNRCFRPH